MRLLQLSLESGEHAALDLHPLLSVVQGLDDRARDRLVRTVAAIAAGAEPPCAGMAEAHGVMLPLDEANIALLDLRTEADPIVRRGDLPGAVDDGSESSVEAPEDPVDDLLRTAPDGLHPELDAARRHLHDTREALRVLREMSDDTARRLTEAAEERRRLSDAVASVSLGDDRVESDVDEVAVLEADLDALDAGIAELTALDLEPVRVLLDAIENPEPQQDVPHPAAQALAAEIVRLHGEVAELEARMESEGRGPVTALARLDAARTEAPAAELALTRPPVSSDDEEELRQAHEVVLDAEQKASGFRSRSGQRKLAAALSVQQEILDRVGYPTWSAYVMGASLMGVDEQAKVRLERAEGELAAAEQAWEHISAALDDDPDHHALLDELEDVEVEAIAVLLETGAPVPEEREDLEPALRALTAPANSASEDDLVATLSHSLHNLGLQVEPSQPERVLVTAHALLEEFAGVPARVEELTAERRRLESQLADARSRAEAKAWEDLEAAVDRPATERIAELEAELVAARAAEEDLAEALEAARRSWRPPPWPSGPPAAAPVPPVWPCSRTRPRPPTTTPTGSGPRSTPRRSSSTSWPACRRSVRSPTPVRCRWCSSTPSGASPTRPSSTCSTPSPACRRRRRSCSSPTTPSSRPGPSSRASSGPRSSASPPSTSERRAAAGARPTHGNGVSGWAYDRGTSRIEEAPCP